MTWDGQTDGLTWMAIAAALLSAPISFQSFLPLRTSLTDTSLPPPSRDEMTAAVATAIASKQKHVVGELQNDQVRARDAGEADRHEGG